MSGGKMGDLVDKAHVERDEGRKRTQNDSMGRGGGRFSAP